MHVAELGVDRVIEAVGLWDDDVYAKNTLEDQSRVGLKPLDGAVVADGVLTVTLPPVSWSAIGLG